MKQDIFISLIILLLTACQSKPDKQLAFAFECAGDNCPELEKVLDHYKDDSLKLKAAQFLITNMPGYEGYDRRLIQKLQPIYEKHIRISEKYNWGNPSGWRKEIKDMWEKERYLYHTKIMKNIKQIFNWLLNAVWAIFFLACIWVLLQVFVFTSFRIPSDSMEPVMEAGDVIVINKSDLNSNQYPLPDTYYCPVLSITN